MLILTRRPGEGLYLGDSVRIIILSVQGKQIKIGLDVPDDMVVYRDEIYQRVKEENRMAMAINNDDFLVAANLWKNVKKKA